MHHPNIIPMHMFLIYIVCKTYHSLKLEIFKEITLNIEKCAKIGYIFVKHFLGGKEINQSIILLNKSYGIVFRQIARKMIQQ